MQTLNIQSIALPQSEVVLSGTINPTERVALPEPPAQVRVLVEVQIGFRKVQVEIANDILATCNYDKYLNAIRQSELAVAHAFKDFLK